MLVKFLRGKVAASRKFQAGDTAELKQSDLFYLREGQDYKILPSGNSTPAEATASPEPPQVAPDEIAEPEPMPEEAPKKKRGRPAKNKTN